MTVPAAATRLTSGFRHGRRTRLGDCLNGICHLCGVLPLCLKRLQDVPALQITAHRLVFGMPLRNAAAGRLRRLTRVHSAFADPRVRYRLCARAALVSAGWLIYVWAIGIHRVVESSLGCFINPVLKVVPGVVVLSERLGRVQSTAGRDCGGGGCSGSHFTASKMATFQSLPEIAPYFAPG